MCANKKKKIKMTKVEVFSPEEFVDKLLSEGENVSCDDSNENFNRYGKLPPFYNEEKFKKGQEFYHHYIFALLLSKIMGLIAILTIPTILKILKFTNMSSEPMTAYKRYLSTVFHMVIWYDKDFKPGSDLWKSLEEVKGKHNFSSNRSCIKGLRRISQKDMALTQFGFMGYAICRSKQIGIHNAKKEDLEAFIHLWKVIGYLMGIEERFSICRDSYEETLAICNLLVDKVFKPNVEKMDPESLQMSTALMEGMWCMMPMIVPSSYYTFLISLNDDRDNKNNAILNQEYEKLSIMHRINFWLIGTVMYLYKFTIVRVYQNLQMYLTFFLMKNFPFLAYYKFGKSNSHVQILSEPVRNAKSG